MGSSESQAAPRRSSLLRSASVVLLLAILALTLTPALASPTHAENITGWTGTSGYVSTGAQGCVAYSGYAYCVAGAGSDGGLVYSSKIQSPGLNSWAAQPYDYANVAYLSCFEYGGYMYCVGGFSGGFVYNYFMSNSLSSGTMGTWSTAIGSYPVPVNSESCVVYSGYATCVGGGTASTSGGTQTSVIASAYYIQLAAAGGVTGSWQSTTALGVTSSSAPSVALDNLSCVQYNGYIYCVGGYNGTTQVNQVWYAKLSSSGGISGYWTQATDYADSTAGDTSGSGGMGIGLTSCAVSGGYIYCVGGQEATNGPQTSAVYYAPLSSSGVGAWSPATSAYPNVSGDSGIEAAACFTSSGYLYCVGGLTTVTSSSSVTWVSAASYAQVASAVPSLPYGVIPLLIAVPALYFLISRRQSGHGTQGTSK